MPPPQRVASRGMVTSRRGTVRRSCSRGEGELSRAGVPLVSYAVYITASSCGWGGEAYFERRDQRLSIPWGGGVSGN
jgi:hypothetical protein